MIGRVQIDGRAVVYEAAGAGQPVVLINGLGSSRGAFWRQVPALAERFRVVTIDNRDAGESDHAGAPYTVGEMADDVAAVIWSLGAGRAHVAGISLGGMIAQELALRQPELVDHLVLIATSPGGAQHTPGEPAVLAQLQAVPAPGETRADLVRRTFPPIAGPGYFDAHPEDLDRIAQLAQANRMSGAGYTRQLGAAMGHDAGARLARITAPTLVVHGEADRLVATANGRRLAALIPGARLLLLPGVGHLPTVEAADTLNRAMLDFFAS